jgi:hypothetical protein
MREGRKKNSILFIPREKVSFVKKSNNNFICEKERELPYQQ